MHMAAYRALKMDWVYLPFLVDLSDLRQALEGVRTFHFAGVNVTIPYKEKVLPFLDHVDSLAQRIGAVNTIVNTDGVLTGYNTDGDGFVLSFQKTGLDFSFDGAHVVILGAGGSARAIAYTLLQQPIASLVLVNRTIETAHCLANDLNDTRVQVQGLSPLPTDVLQRATLVINTTSLGMTPMEDLCPVDSFEWVSATTWCCDIIYTPAQTLFLKRAKAAGAHIMNGAGMLAGQGVLAFALLTGRSIDYDVMFSQLAV